MESRSPSNACAGSARTCSSCRLTAAASARSRAARARTAGRCGGPDPRLLRADERREVGGGDDADTPDDDDRGKHARVAPDERVAEESTDRAPELHDVFARLVPDAVVDGEGCG